MMKMEQLTDAVEALVDENGMVQVLRALNHMCYVKAEHMRSDWQDEAMALIWENMADSLEKTEAKAIRMGL